MSQRGGPGAPEEQESPALSQPGSSSSPHSSGFSSELSPQSSSPSHFHASGLHRVLLHWNSSRGQVRTGHHGQQRAKNEL